VFDEVWFRQSMLDKQSPAGAVYFTNEPEKRRKESEGTHLNVV